MSINYITNEYYKILKISQLAIFHLYYEKIYLLNIIIRMNNTKN